MEKMKFETSNLTAANIAKLAELFPGVVVEGKVNVDLLRSYVGEEIFGDEAYEFTWVGKRAAIAEAGRPIRKTLRPCVEESKNWDTTENLYIEGDNLDVLKLLQESYLGKVKMIYIDPPYNTGNDFIYRDNFAQSRGDYEDESGMYDEDGDRLFRNTETNGRFHSDWCSMIYPRLVLARNMLCDDGAIFISIDDNEVAQLRKICDEVFGGSNFICQFIWKSKLGKVGTTSTISLTHEYIICYGKRTDVLKFKMIENISDGRRENLRQWGQADRREDRPSMFYPLVIDGVEVYPIKEDGTEGRWRIGREMAKELLEKGLLELVDKEGKYQIYRIFEAGISITPYDTLLLDEIGTTAKGSLALKALDIQRTFDYSKPVELIKHFAMLCTIDNDIILDFFSGSATTAHAVMQLNAEDGGKRKFIMVQLPEVCADDSEAAKAGYKNICEIGKERIRRAGDAIVNSGKLLVDSKDSKNSNHCSLNTNHLDTGFRVLKLDDTNMNDVYYAAGDYTQDLLLAMENNIKPDRTDMDLLYGCLLDWGLPLSMPHTREWLVDSDKWLEIEKELKNNGCHKLYRFDGLAESNGVSGGSVSVSEETAKRGVVCIVGSNAASCSFNSFKHSGRASAPIDKGVYKLSVCGTGVEGGTGNTTACVRESGLPCRFGYNNSNAISSGSGQNAECPHENTNHCPLNTNHLICVHTYNGGDLIACFEERISEKAIREIAGRKPLRAVFRDSGFTSSPEKINVFEIFKLIAPNTNVRVI